ncbi:MAG: hypothetical protein K1Y36_30670 [Blastocatellia bacterium]|nr:hypothetical protein [Blastocatellia bacterium]
MTFLFFFLLLFAMAALGWLGHIEYLKWTQPETETENTRCEVSRPYEKGVVAEYRIQRTADGEAHRLVLRTDGRLVRCNDGRVIASGVSTGTAEAIVERLQAAHQHAAELRA